MSVAHLQRMLTAMFLAEAADPVVRDHELPEEMAAVLVLDVREAREMVAVAVAEVVSDWPRTADPERPKKN